MYENDKFVYAPEIDYKNIDPRDSEKILNILEDFKKSYVIPLQLHINTADSFRQYLNSPNVPQELRSAINVKSEEIERDLMQIVRIYSQVESRLEAHNLLSDATHFFHSVFPGEESNDVKINYLKMIRTFEYIRSFNRNIRESWEQIRETFEHFKATPTSKSFLEQILEFKVYPRIELCEKTDLLLRRMQYILKLPEDYETARKINYAGNYTSMLNYNLGTIFQLDLDRYIVLESKDKQEEFSESQVDSNTCIKDPFFLDSRGVMAFNQSYLYTLSINDTRVASDREKIQKAVYLETHLTIENKSLRQDMIHHFISSSKKTNKESEYVSFLMEHFDFTRDGLSFHLDYLTSKEKIIFMYHFGPIFFLKLLMQFLREGHTGYIHRFMGHHNMARELPFEFIKFTLKDWWDTNVFKLCSSSERNSKDHYTNLITIFTQQWEKEQPSVLQKIILDSTATKAYNIRDYKMLRPFLEKELSFLFYCIYNRFLGTDFLHMPLNKVPRQLAQSSY